MAEKQYLHNVGGMPFTEKHCSKCLWYNSIEKVDEKGWYVINCASKECTYGADPLNVLINGLIKYAPRDRFCQTGNY